MNYISYDASIMSIKIKDIIEKHNVYGVIPKFAFIHSEEERYRNIYKKHQMSEFI